MLGYRGLKRCFVRVAVVRGIRRAYIFGSQRNMILRA